jgi:hypothetical protein
MREGMALRTHEFVVCQEERHRPLILSEVRRIVVFKPFLLNIRSSLVHIATAASVLALQ